LKILLVHDYCSRDGGAEAGCETLRNGLRARGFEVRILAARTGPNEIADDLCYGTKRSHRTLLQTANPSAWWALRKVLRDWKPDVVHVRMFLTQLSPLILPLLHNVPSIYHAVWYRAICPKGTKVLPGGKPCPFTWGKACLREGCLPARDWAPLMLQMRMLEAGRGAFRRTVANSHALAERMDVAGAGPAEVIWNGVPEAPIDRTRSEIPSVAFAGRLVPEKGVDVLLRALAKLPEGRLIVAGDGPERLALEALARELGIADRVRFAGLLDRDALVREVRGVWAHAAPSVWREPFGMVAPEAMMRGTPVVASAAGGLAEVVVDGETGMLVAPGDVDALSSALGRIFADRQLSLKLGAAGRERAMRHFHEAVWVERFAELYAKVCAERAA
jgi:glycosyltransferase involved in cell wall biosynthesis